jgi:hypothetical protein
MTLFRKFCMAFATICLIGLASWMAFMLYNKPEILISMVSIAVIVGGTSLFFIGLAEMEDVYSKWKEQK